MKACVLIIRQISGQRRLIVDMNYGQSTGGLET